MLEVIRSIIEKCDSDQPNIRPTEIYNEGWMLNALLHWFAENPQIKGHQLSFWPQSRWYSESLLPTQFKRIPKTESFSQEWNKSAENHTHADGAMGHFDIGTEGRKENLALRKEAQQFIVIEAKMFSKLSKGTSNARSYNQAARNVACMAEILRQTYNKYHPNIPIEQWLNNFTSNNTDSSHGLGFYVVAPECNRYLFEDMTQAGAIETVVRERIQLHKTIAPTKKDLQQFEKCFIGLMEIIDIGFMPWEDLIEFITKQDQNYGASFDIFYQKCVEFNR